MTAQILDGRAVSRRLRANLRRQVAAFAIEQGWAPHLAVVQAGNDPASAWYVGQIEKSAKRVGIGFSLHTTPNSAQTGDVVDLLAQLGINRGIHGIIVQIPLPKHIDSEQVIAALKPGKDVDGIHPLNAGLLMQGNPLAFVPATPAGGMELLRQYEIDLRGKRAVMVGRSNIVGRPMAILMLHQHATVTICHSRTRDLASRVREAEVVVAAVGRPGIITPQMVAPGVVVIDFGVNVIDNKLFGDMDAAVAEVAGYVTPVPGGTGPMTNVMLMRNTLTAARRQADR